MTTGQESPVPFYCPQCGGPMYRPANSPFYWHATNNHPPCTITNIAEPPKSATSSVEPPPASAAEQAKKQRPEVG